MRRSSLNQMIMPAEAKGIDSPEVGSAENVVPSSGQAASPRSPGKASNLSLITALSKVMQEKLQARAAKQSQE